MPLTPTVLFDLPQREIASLITDRMAQASAFSIVTGFATPGGLSAISGPITAQPQKLTTLVVGAATYPGFEALDDLLAAGVPPDRLHVHLGHTAATGGHNNPFARFHPMLHSKVYYMELPGGNACAFIGSHNVTSFALTGLNGEAAVLLEGPMASPEFDKVRQHIATARSQAAPYTPGMKEAFAWWTRQFLEGLTVEMKIPRDWTSVRTILLFASAASGDRPKTGDHLYFEIPAGIEQIESLKTEAHLFLFNTLPETPWQALDAALSAQSRYTCITLGAENKQGNKELAAHWRLDGSPRPVLTRVPGATYRPSTPAGMQQVRAEIKAPSVQPFEYLFESESVAWDPKFAEGDKNELALPHVRGDTSALGDDGMAPELPMARLKNSALNEVRGGYRSIRGWKLVKGLTRRQGSPQEKDAAALMLASPESGSFILVSLRRRRHDRTSIA